MDATGAFSALASSPLPSLNIGSDIHTTWNRSSFGDNNTGGGGRSFGTNQISLNDQTDPFLLASTTSSNNKPSNNKKPEPFLSVTEILQKRQDEILNQIWRQEEDDTRRRLQEMVDKQLQDDWNRERDKWLQEIAGTRTLGGLSLVVQQQGGGGGGETTIMPQRTATTAITASSSRSSSQVAVNPAIIQSHLNVVKRMSDGIDIILEFQRVADTLGNSRHAPAYVNAWRLLSSIMATRRRWGSSSTNNRTTTTTSEPLQTTFGALLYLAKIYQTRINSRVQSFLLTNQDMTNMATYRNAMANRIAIFVQLELGSVQGVWPVLFYALRCGDAAAAVDILDVVANEWSSDEVVVPLRTVLSALSQGQAESDCFWESRPPPMVSAQDRQTLSGLYEFAVSGQQEPKNAYRVGVLALLCGKNSPLLSSIENTVEDYLYKELWRITHESKSSKELVEFGTLIKRYGPSYFEDDEPFGWPFALPLLVTQQYRTALSYLAEAGGPMGLLQATHLGLALHRSGVALNDFGETASSALSSDQILTTLLKHYASAIRVEPSVGNAASLEYLVQIPQKELAMKEIATLIVKTRDIVTLAGTLSAEGERKPGALDQHLTPALVSAVLADAGNMLLADAYEKGKVIDAGNLFMLAGYYGSILNLLNQMLSPPEISNEDRGYWYQQAQIFHSTYLSKRSPVTDVLEKEGQQALVTTSRVLMELCLFFEQLRTNRFTDAIEAIYRLQLLPTKTEELPVKETNFASLDPLLQQPFPAVLKGTLKALYEQYSQLKRDAQGRTSDVLQGTLQDLRKRASVLVVFAGLLPNISSDVKSAMAQMEARMI